MTLEPGTRIGPYEILSLLGAGGMGEVYRARDMRLERTVAVKILPAHLSERLWAKERFEREAKAISSLNHPNICQLYDVGSQDGTSYLVMEHLEGETLADRIRKGPMPVDQVLRYGIDICEGLDQAHRTGVVHRDLKPGNIMLTKSGAKLMDFGLAKPFFTGTNADSSSLRTVSHQLTTEGSLVGTFQYMSPEQVEGKDLDGRSDLFSLGVVLYEMVSGKRAFEGKGALGVASAILEKEPEPISVLKPQTPGALDHAIRTCLAKDPETRWQTGRDLAHALRWIAEGGSRAGASGDSVRRRTSREGMLLTALGAVAAIALVLAFLYLRSVPAQMRVTRTYIKPAADTSFLLSDGSGFALSPNGASLAYVATTSSGKSLLWVRPIDSLIARSLRGTEGAKYPFWSPDSRSIAFFSAGKLQTIEASGSPPLTVCDASEGRGGTWNRQGEILFAPAVNTGLFRVAATGGTPVPVTTLEPSKNEISHRWPWFLPDGRHFLFLAGSVFTSTENPTNWIIAGSLDSAELKPLFRTHAGAIYVSGEILYLRKSTLTAQAFDPVRLELTGGARPITDPVGEAELYSKGQFSASENGLLTYVEGGGGANRQLVWFDRSGKQVDAVPGAGAYASPRISPDGKRLAYYQDFAGYDVWTFDIARGVKTPQTFSSATAHASIFPIWSPDGTRIAYTSYREGKYLLAQKVADGSSSEEVLLDGVDRYRFPFDWSPDGRFLAYHEGAQGGWAVWILPLDGARKPFPFLPSRYGGRDPTFSPDGRWLAYASNESGEYRVYVVPFPGPGGKWQISSGGGDTPRWRRDGREIFYFSSDNHVMAVAVQPGVANVEVGAARALFETRSFGVFSRFDVSADGQRFLVPFEEGQASTGIALVVNWPADLK